MMRMWSDGKMRSVEHEHTGAYKSIRDYCEMRQAEEVLRLVSANRWLRDILSQRQEKAKAAAK